MDIRSFGSRESRARASTGDRARFSCRRRSGFTSISIRAKNRRAISPLKPWGFTYQVEDLVKTLEVEASGGTQIDYKDQDPEIHATFVAECAKRGVEVRLKF